MRPRWKIVVHCDSEDQRSVLGFVISTRLHSQTIDCNNTVEILRIIADPTEVRCVLLVHTETGSVLEMAARIKKITDTNPNVPIVLLDPMNTCPAGSATVVLRGALNVPELLESIGRVGVRKRGPKPAALVMAKAA
jgi:hypothetical protein